MKTLTTIAEMQTAVAGLRGLGQRIGFVPTMGALHEGHLSLVRRSKQETDVTVVSIFVNPAQFGPHEDYLRYPRDLERDSALLLREGADLLFAPSVEEMYPNDFQSYVSVERVATPFEGQFRPGHFRGVATVVLKLFNIVQPHRAYFGQKDAQQCAVVRQLVRDLSLPVEIIVCPIVREPDGLAMSSRNAYLKPDERQAALVLSRSLARARELIEAGERRAEVLAQQVRNVIEQEPKARIDYVGVADADTFEARDTLAGRTVIALAVWIGGARLLDNLIVEETPAGLQFRA
ncbi:MAG TPA: pantoate--beta-alanine ligase [Candidatus Xenobia bacterium]|nr:pantoate--beta-alanine ligase [Candidatus Xenobia bacterium]